MTAPLPLPRGARRDDLHALGPLARLAGQATVVLALLTGFAVLYEYLPPLLAPLLVVPATACVLLAPRARRARLRLSLPLLALLAWAALSFGWSVSPQTSLAQVWQDLLPVLAVAVVGALLPREALAAALVWSVRLTLLLVVLALLVRPETRTSGTAEFAVEGWRGTFPDKNSLALYLAFALATLLVWDRGAPRALALATVGALLAGAQSATGATACLLVVLVAVWLRVLRQRRGRESAVLVLGSTTLGAAFVLLVVTNLAAVLQLYGRDADLTGRTEIWAAVAAAVVERPLTGYGLGALLDLEAPSPVTYQLWDAIGFRAVHAHNGALDLVGQIGLAGLALYLLALGSTVAAAVRRWRRSPLSSSWVLLVVPALLLMSFTEPVLLGPWLLVLALLQAGFLRQDAETSARRDLERRRGLGVGGRLGPAGARAVAGRRATAAAGRAGEDGQQPVAQVRQG